MRLNKLAPVFIGALLLLGTGALLARDAEDPQEKPLKEEFAAWAVNLGRPVS